MSNSQSTFEVHRGPSGQDDGRSAEFEPIAESLSRDSTHRTATEAKHEHAHNAEQKIGFSSFAPDAAHEHGAVGHGHTDSSHQASDGATSHGQAEGAGQGQEVEE